MTTKTVKEDSLAHEKRRSETYFGYARFLKEVLICLFIGLLSFSLISYGIPFMREGRESSATTTRAMAKLEVIIDDSGARLDSILARADSTVAHLDQTALHIQGISDTLDLRLPGFFDSITSTLNTARFSVATLTSSAGTTISSLTALTNDFNKRLNGDFGLMAGITKMASDLNTDVHTVSAAAAKMIGEGTTTIAEIRKFALDPQWAEARTQVVNLLTHADQLTIQAVGTATDIHVITKALADKAPTFFALLEKALKTSSGFQKPILILTILGLITKALAGVVF